jgi:hypothetical protein
MSATLGGRCQLLSRPPDADVLAAAGLASHGRDGSLQRMEICVAERVQMLPAGAGSHLPGVGS